MSQILRDRAEDVVLRTADSEPRKMGPGIEGEIRNRADIGLRRVRSAQLLRKRAAGIIGHRNRQRDTLSNPRSID